MSWLLQITEALFLTILYVVIPCTTGSLNAKSEQWLWSWECKRDVCVKSAIPLVYESPPLDTSLDVCRLTCGTYGSLWPRPTGATRLGSEVVATHPSLVSFQLSDECREFLGGGGGATSTLLGNLGRECGGVCLDPRGVEVAVAVRAGSASTKLDWETDESYTLDLVTTQDGSRVDVTISAATVYGARHGLETLSQLFASHAGSLYVMAAAHVVDAPAYPHRGLLLDTARNYLSPAAMRRQLDGMAACKMNVLHWHATDSQSFPLVIPHVPQLSRYGAYSPRQVYTPEDVSELLGYARSRGIRVIMEIDAPAHAGNGWQWGPSAGLGDLAVCVNRQPWRKFCIQPPCGQLNPANPNMYVVLRQLYKDLVAMFPKGEVFHMGGDEVFLPCWNATEEVVTWMEASGRGRSTTDFLDVWSGFQAESLHILDEETGDGNKTPVMLWSSHLTAEDVVERYLDKDRYVIETWVEGSNPLPRQLLAKGYRLVMATKDAWYLDHGFWGITRYHNWWVAYDNKLPALADGVLGGETAMWGELVDEQSIDGRVWPRTAAAAERLWSDPDTGSRLAKTRLLQMRRRLIARGVGAEAITPGWCDQNQKLCY